MFDFLKDLRNKRTEELARLSEAGDPTETTAKAAELSDEQKAAEEATLAKAQAEALEEQATPPGWRGFYRRHLHNFTGVLFVTAFAIVLLTELWARHSLVKGLGFLVLDFPTFLVNVLIVFATLSVAMFFRRKMFVFTIIATVWALLGVANGAILRSRMTPLTTADFAELRDGISLLTTYFTTKQIILYAIAIVAVVAVVILLFIKMPKTKEERSLRRAAVSVAVIWLVMFGCLFGGIRMGIMDTYFPNLAYGYRDNGFNYCFLATWLDRGLAKPKPYTAESINDIFAVEERNTTVPGRLALTPEQQSEVPAAADENYPNIIIVQLESFMDPLCMEGFEYNQDPMPTFRALAKEYSDGRIQVPSMGAGTANTEYELLTGMSVRFYGAGETPYKTTLLDRTCEGLPYDLKAYGYSSHAIHNHRGAFYGRNKVYPNLGFDTFTCLEYMNNITRTPKNWAKDDILPEQIFDALNYTSGKDFIFAVSVQGHGKYPPEQVLMDPKIRVTAMPEDADESLRWQWEYYANQLYEMDLFVADLVARVETYEEPTVVLFYGDHMPAIDNISEETLKEGRNIFQTDYLIYSNFPMKERDQDLYAYQVAAELLDQLNIHNGTLFTYHQNHRDDPAYMDNFEALQYDMLFGKRYIYDGETPYLPTTMKMGIRDIVIQDVVKVGEKYYIRGQNFTEYSKVNLDGEILDTKYLGPTLLELREDVDPDAVVRMRVSQVEKDKEILSTSE